VSFLRNWWRRRQRAIDLEILWPKCKHEARLKYDDPSVALDVARAAFAMHAFNDEAWLALGEAEMISLIGELK
jgi:hypothetical protein